MARKKIIWSETATIMLFDILDFYRNRNQSDVYSKKLFKKIRKSVSWLKKYPKMGVETDIENVRSLVIENYILFYKNEKLTLIILSIWDTRQNPDLIKIK